MDRFGTWPFYTDECVEDVRKLVADNMPLTAYRANPQVGVNPVEGSWAWRLERKIEEMFKVKHCVAVSSGTAALHCMLKSIENIGCEAHIATSPFTFSASVAAILHAGYKPFLFDVNESDSDFPYHVDCLHSLLTLDVQIFGKARNHCKLEDACQAVGARIGDRYAGTFGVAGCYSFNGGKNVPAGEGGAMVTDHDEIARRARLFMNHGENFGHWDVGLNYRLTEIHACLAYHGVESLEVRNNHRISLAKHLTEQLSDIDCLKLPSLEGDFDGSHVFYVYPFEIHNGRRKEFAQKLRESGVEIGEGYIQPPLHEYEVFKRYCYGPLPRVEKLSEETLCILSQVRPPASHEDMDFIAEKIREAL